MHPIAMNSDPVAICWVWMRRLPMLEDHRLLNLYYNVTIYDAKFKANKKRRKKQKNS